MRSHKFIVLLLFLAFASSAHSQTIIATSPKFVILENDPNLIMGNEYFVLKKLDNGEIVQVGKVKLIREIKGKLAGKITAKSPNYNIAKGDFLRMPTYAVGKKSNFLTYSSIGAGLIAAGAGYYFYDQGNKAFDDYEQAQTSLEAIELYEDTRTWDRKSQISYGVGGTLITMGVLYAILNREKPVRDFLEPPSESSFFSVGTLGAGLLAAGLGYYFQSEADKTYEDYEAAVTMEDAKKYYDDTESLDKRSQLCYGIGGALVGFAILHKISKPSASQTNTGDRLSITPVGKRGFYGLSAKLSLNSPKKKK